MDKLPVNNTVLKPCPFCGSEKVELAAAKNGYEHYVECECGARGSEYDSDNNEPDMQQVINAWNTRIMTTPDKLPVYNLGNDGWTILPNIRQYYPFGVNYNRPSVIQQAWQCKKSGKIEWRAVPVAIGEVTNG